MDRTEFTLSFLNVILAIFTVSCLVMGIGLLVSSDPQGALIVFTLTILNFITAVGCYLFTAHNFPHMIYQ
jgi:hypothetical protein